MLNFSTNWSQIADIGFLLLVTGISLRSLLADRDTLHKQRLQWKEELTDLESSLRELISEATDASRVFDSKLQRRQSELEAILNSIDAKVAKVSNSSSHFKMVPAEDDDSIDPPWAREAELPRHLESRVEKTYDTVYSKSNSRSTKSNINDIVAKPKPSKNSLMEKIEVQEVDPDQYIFQQTNIVDPVAFRIAKRLLLEGKELHVISRKLDIPVSEIRHLDSLLRSGENKDADGSLLKQKELMDVKQVIRDKSKSVSSKEAEIMRSLGLENYLER